jgi:hypothetical protein
VNLLHFLAKSDRGRRRVLGLLRGDPELAVEALSPILNRPPRFTNVDLPDGIDGFEDLAFLFSSGPLNHGIVSMSFEEAAFLWRRAREMGPGAAVEIGRYKGGGTLLLAAALPAGAHLYSYDLRKKLTSEFDHAELDAELLSALSRYSLEAKVSLVVADSTTVELPPEPVALVVVDGDHSYSGARGDYEHWVGALAPGGAMLFHDSGDEDVARLLEEIEREAVLERVARVGTLTEYRARP